jgi:alginate O-acetyltransferase complex protein AlgI
VAWLGLVCYGLQIYFDFSGYSCMAIGLGWMFGFRFLENFNYPYVARSITEFWRRWHISLSTWFRDYLYVPLGGNRVSPWRLYLNLMLVFLLCGLWHGASWNFVIWGLMHGLLLIVERLGWRDFLAKRSAVLAHAYVLLAVLLAWVPFRIETLTQSLSFYQALFGLTAGDAAYHVGLYLRPGLVLALSCGVVGSTPFVPWLKDKLNSLTQGRDAAIATWGGGAAAFGGVALTCMLLAACMIELSASTYDPFIYFRF